MKYSLITLHILKSLVEESSLQPHFLGFTVLLCKDKKTFYTHNYVGSTFRGTFFTTLYHQSDFTFSKLLQKLLVSTPKICKTLHYGLATASQ